MAIKTRRISILDKLSLIAGSLMFLNVFFGFDSHHDGLILSTVSLTEDAIKNGGPWPFNQYGPAWNLLFFPIAAFLPVDYLYLAMRLITFLIYILTFFLLRRISREFFASCSFSHRLVGFVFLLSQPFFTDFGSTFVVWPSATAMIFGTITFYLTLKAQQVQFFFLWSLVGVFIGLTFLTRVQVGLFSFLFAIFISHKAISKISLVSVITGFCCTLGIVYGYLASIDKLTQTLSDQFVFALTYLTGDKSTYPIPVFTLLGVILIFLFLATLPLFFRILKVRLPIVILFFALLSLVLSTIFVYLTQRKFVLGIQTLVTIQRRFWVCLIIASVLYSVFQHLVSILKHRTHNLDNKQLILLGFSVINLTQAYPLFDLMHVWWGSVPGTILVVQAITRLSAVFQYKRSRNTKWFLFLPLLPMVIASISYLQQPYSFISNYSLGGILIPKEQALTMEKRTEFFSNNLSARSSVTNLCENSDVYLQKETMVKPSNSYFVYWASMAQVHRISDVIQNGTKANSSFVLTCSMTQIPALSGSNQLTMEKLLRTLVAERKLERISEELEIEGRVWNIWRASR